MKSAGRSACATKTKMPGFPTKCIGSGVRTPVESTGLRKPETHKPRPFGFAQGKKDPFDFAQDKPALHLNLGKSRSLD